MSLNETPRSNRIHIGIFGKTNSGKSTLINAMAGQDVALVSDIGGTTTDPVYKAIELHPLGPCVLIDTAGFDDQSLLGKARVHATKKVIPKTDIGLILFASEDIEEEKIWIQDLQTKKIPVVAIINKTDTGWDYSKVQDQLLKEFGLETVLVSALHKKNIDEVRQALVRKLQTEISEPTICGHLVSSGDLVLLVMPQDIQAPKGRLILPQVQTIRDLLDHHCIVVSCTIDQLQKTIQSLVHPPKVIITDSQVFPEVEQLKPSESLLTSFSVLFSKYKGDIDIFVEGAKAIDQLGPGSRVLIAEACTHNPLDGDIGRIKIPHLLKTKINKDIQIEVVSGHDFPEDLAPYDLIIHCGSCMFNRKYVMHRIEKAIAAKVPITNYGLSIAYISGMIDRIVK